MENNSTFYMLVKPFENCAALWYKSQFMVNKNALVSIPLRNRTTFGIVQEISKSCPLAKNIALKEIGPVITLSDTNFEKYIEKVAFIHQLSPEILYAKITNFLSEHEPHSTVLEEKENIDINLTPKQLAIAQTIINSNFGFSPHLLHGITGSGKTEIYKYLIKDILNKNLSVIITAPEITVASQLFRELKSITNKLFSLHTGTTPKERQRLWEAIKNNESIVILGVHLPVLLPISNLGLIIVDEEHESGYQEKQYPHLNSRDCLMLRAQCYNIPIVLGSATPTVNSYNLFKQHNWPILKLNERFKGKTPETKLVYFKYDKSRANFWITSTLEAAIRENFQKKEQTLIFLNRRGYSFFLRCDSCQEIPSCKRCSTSLTPHEDSTMKCHYCDYGAKIISTCNFCKQETNFLHKGIGTQQLVQILKKMFPDAVIERADLDITKSKKRWESIVKGMLNKKIDILVGTQTIAKGLHFPNISLVGVIWADLNLNLPHYNAAEKTLQQLLQVSGRAGRLLEKSQVIIQTMNHHYIFNFLNENKYVDFLEHEALNRKQTGYPPFCRLIRVELKNKNKEILYKEAFKLYQNMQNILSQPELSIQVFAPITPSVEKIEGIYKEQIYIKAHNLNVVAKAFGSIITKHSFKSLIIFSPNPLD